MSTATRIQTVSFAVVQQVASRMFDPMQPTTGYFAFAGEQYRRLCKASAEENVSGGVRCGWVWTVQGYREGASSDLSTGCLATVGGAS